MEKRRERVHTSRRVQELIETIAYDEEEDYTGMGFEFVPTEWLLRYYQCPQAASLIETSRYLCLHGKLDLDRLSEVKVISAIAADVLYEEAGQGEGPRLTPDALCRICVRNKYRQVKLDKESMEDAKLIMELLKEPLDE